MIEVWTWPTPNGHKVHIMLEECGLPYKVVPVDIRAGEQFKPEFLAITPNHRIPAIVDPDGPGGRRLALFESGAILIYLAEKTGRFIPADGIARYTCLQWLMFQMGGIGPMFGQLNHFRNYAKEKLAYPVERYMNETQRLMRVLAKRLAEAPYLAGDEYSIADMAAWPWVRGSDTRGVPLADYPEVKAWVDRIAARPAVQKAVQVLADKQRSAPITDKERDVMFGATQFARR
ncbi:MAG: glutathione S-transferase N-terminal domain-containing protein [Alphaproteobacteria bacterium]|nr:glutathione S-transferase N-terminal domain-containing protein [Alphaproteobacteria bacterium]